MAGHTVIVPDMPGHGRDWTPPGLVTMQDYVNTITQILDATAEPVVLVVHSRNGIVAAHAAEARPEKIRTLVYLASYLPPIGDTLALAQSEHEGQWAHDPDSLLWAKQSVDVDREAGSDMLRRQAFREALHADCLDDDVALAYALLTPEPRGPRSPLNFTRLTDPPILDLRPPAAYFDLKARAGVPAASGTGILWRR